MVPPHTGEPGRLSLVHRACVRPVCSSTSLRHCLHLARFGLVSSSDSPLFLLGPESPKRPLPLILT